MVFEDTLTKNAVRLGESVGWKKDERISLSGICSLRELRSRYAPLHIPLRSPRGPYKPKGKS